MHFSRALLCAPLSDFNFTDLKTETRHRCYCSVKVNLCPAFTCWHKKYWVRISTTNAFFALQLHPRGSATATPPPPAVVAIWFISSIQQELICQGQWVWLKIPYYHEPGSRYAVTAEHGCRHADRFSVQYVLDVLVRTHMHALCVFACLLMHERVHE